MIDLAQWRARPANGHQCHSFKGTVDSKSGISIISVEKTTELPTAAVPVIALLLLLYICFPLSRIDYTPPTGKPLLYTLYSIYCY